MTTPSALRSLVRLLVSILAALLMAGLAQCQVGGPPLASATPSLEPGTVLERTIRGEEKQPFEFELMTGTFLFLEISSRSENLSFRWVGPNGATSFEAAGFGPHLLATIADLDGTYRFEATAPKKQQASTQFTVKILDLRPVSSKDEARVRAARILAEARRLLSSEDQAQRPQAEALLTESLTSWQAAADSRGEVEALLENAKFRSDQGAMAEALVWYDKAIKRAREGDYPREEARALEGIGFCNSRLERYEEAIGAYREALRIWGQVGGPFERSFAHQRLAGVYWRKQDFQGALQAFEDALGLAKESGDLAQQGSSMAGVGGAYYRLGRLGKARELSEKALELSRQAGDGRTEVEIEHNLAAFYQNEGQLQKALDLFIRVAARQSPRDAGMTRYNMGNLYLLLGDADRALENYKLSQAACHSAGDSKNEVNSVVGIGRVHQAKGDARSALAEFLKARRLVVEEPWMVPHFIGLAQIDLGQYSEALHSLRRALEMAGSKHDRAQEAATLLALGSAYTKLGQTDLAAESFTDAIASGNEIGYQTVVGLALLKRSMLRRDENRLEMALADVEDAIAVIESTRRNIAGDQFRTGFFAAKRTYYDVDIDLLMRLERLRPNQGYRARALAASEQARARGLLDLLAEGRIDIRQGLDPDLRQREEDLSDQISRLQRELRAGNPAPQRLQQLRAERDALDVQWDQLEVEVQSKNKRYAEVRYPAPLNLDEIQRQILDDRTALLEYVLGEKSSILFVITREGFRSYDLPAADEIAKQILRLREALEQETFLKRRDYLESAFQLYRDLVAPAEEALAGKSNLLIVPDGALYYIPFEALLSAPGERPLRDLPYLLHRFSIAYVPSASVLAGLREPRKLPSLSDRKQVVGFAPFAGPGSESVTRGSESSPSSEPAASLFTPLPASGREIAKIAGLYPGSALTFVGGAADEAAVTGNPAVATARRLHFATHAQIDEHHPEYSALVLAERPGEDGLLQMREILNLKLSADLVVLSACQTALGKEVTGEGLVGLTRAFFYAGVPSLVVSLWNVVDGPTPDLMLDFYQELDRLQDKAKALRTSKLSMIAHGTYAHPSYWAPFILLGEPR